MIERHRDGIAHLLRSAQPVIHRVRRGLGSVEGLSGKIRLIRQRACGLHEEPRLKLKVLPRMLPEV